MSVNEEIAAMTAIRREEALKAAQNDFRAPDFEAVKREYGEEAYWRAVDAYADKHAAREAERAREQVEDERFEGMTDEEAVKELKGMRSKFMTMANRVQRKGLHIEFYLSDAHGSRLNGLLSKDKEPGGFNFEVSRVIK